MLHCIYTLLLLEIRTLLRVANKISTWHQKYTTIQYTHKNRKKKHKIKFIKKYITIFKLQFHSIPILKLKYKKKIPEKGTQCNTMSSRKTPELPFKNGRVNKLFVFIDPYKIVQSIWHWVLSSHLCKWPSNILNFKPY